MLSIATTALPSSIRGSFSRRNSDSEQSKDGTSDQKKSKTDLLDTTRLSDTSGTSSFPTPISTPKEENKQLDIESSTSLQENLTGTVEPTTNVDTTQVIVQPLIQPSGSPNNSIASLTIEHFNRELDDDLTTPIAGDIASQIPPASNASSTTLNDRSDSLLSDISSSQKSTKKSNSAKSSKQKKSQGLNGSILDENLLIDSPPVNGCVPAAPRRNLEFHALFRSVPEEDFLINDYGCALQKEILVQGRLYVSANHVCFNANIFGWVTNLVIAFSDIVSIEKRMTAFVIPNAIQISTLHAKHFFTTFLSRDGVYELLFALWKQTHPSFTVGSVTESECGTSRRGSDASETSIDNFLSSDDEGKSTTEQGGPRKKFVLPKLTLDPMRLMRGYSNSTLISSEDDDSTSNQEKADNTFQSLPPSPKLRSSSLSKELKTHIPKSKSDIDIADLKRSEKHRPLSPRSQSRHLSSSNVKKRRPTQCACLKKKEHYENVSLDTKFIGSVEKIFNLLFTSEFLKRYIIDEEKCTDVEIGEWNTENYKWTRFQSYVKPLSNPIGPRSTKCIIEEECQHRDFDNYVTCFMVARTPDVPSGSSFCVKNRICVMWAGANESRVIVTCTVEWSKQSWLKGTIERACIDGQQTRWKELAQVIKKYISAHPSEFSDESGTPAQEEETVDSEMTDEKVPLKRAHSRLRPTATEISDLQENEPKGLQQYNIVINTISSIINSLTQIVPIPSTNAIMLLILLMLVINNLLTLRSIGFKLDNLDAGGRSYFSPKPREFMPLSIENIEDEDPLWQWLLERSKTYDDAKNTYHKSNSESTSDHVTTSSQIHNSDSHHSESRSISSQSLTEQIGDIYKLIQVAEGHVKKLIDVAEFENSHYKDSEDMSRQHHEL